MPLTREQKTIEFELLWRQYPQKDGKKAALRSFFATVRTYGELDNIKKALSNYTSHLKAPCNEWKRAKNGSTWFNNWEDWVDYDGSAGARVAEQVKPLTPERIADIKYRFSDECQNRVRLRLGQAWHRAVLRLRLDKDEVI